MLTGGEAECWLWNRQAREPWGIGAAGEGSAGQEAAHGWGGRQQLKGRRLGMQSKDRMGHRTTVLVTYGGEEEGQLKYGL